MEGQGSGRSCVFCGKDHGLSREHVFPEWLLELRSVGENDPRRNTRNLGWLDEEGTVQWKQRDEGPIQAPSVVKVVCEKHCNNGWMSDLERDAKPLLEPLIYGHATTLRVRDQKLIAFWAAKTVAVLEYTDHADLHVVSQEQKHALYRGRETREIPETFRVWIGIREHQEEVRLGYHHLAASMSRRGGPVSVVDQPEKANVQLTTLMLGDLVMLVASTPLKLPRFDLGFGWATPMLRKIHPRPAHFRFPPAGRKFNDEAIRFVGNALAQIAPADPKGGPRPGTT